MLYKILKKRVYLLYSKKNFKRYTQPLYLIGGYYNSVLRLQGSVYEGTKKLTLAGNNNTKHLTTYNKVPFLLIETLR